MIISERDDYDDNGHEVNQLQEVKEKIEYLSFFKFSGIIYIVIFQSYFCIYL